MGSSAIAEHLRFRTTRKLSVFGGTPRDAGGTWPLIFTRCLLHQADRKKCFQRLPCYMKAKLPLKSHSLWNMVVSEACIYTYAFSFKVRNTFYAKKKKNTLQICAIPSRLVSMALHYHFTTKIFWGNKIMLRLLNYTELGIEQH